MTLSCIFNFYYYYIVAFLSTPPTLRGAILKCSYNRLDDIYVQNVSEQTVFGNAI
jgi:hypothetical protein